MEGCAKILLSYLFGDRFQTKPVPGRFKSWRREKKLNLNLSILEMGISSDLLSFSSKHRIIGRQWKSLHRLQVSNVIFIKIRSTSHQRYKLLLSLISLILNGYLMKTSCFRRRR